MFCGISMNKIIIVLILVFLLVGVVGASVPGVILLSNDIDFANANGLMLFLSNNDVIVKRVNASEFDRYKEHHVIVMLGGHLAYDGVGDIVGGILTHDEKLDLEQSNASETYYKRGVWMENQDVIIFAGNNRNLTKSAHIKNVAEILNFLITARMVSYKAAITTVRLPELHNMYATYNGIWSDDYDGLRIETVGGGVSKIILSIYNGYDETLDFVVDVRTGNTIHIPFITNIYIPRILPGTTTKERVVYLSPATISGKHTMIVRLSSENIEKEITIMF